RAGGVPGKALVPNDLAGAHVLANRHRRRWLHMRIPGLQVRRVGDDHDPGRVGAVCVVPAHIHDRALARGPDRRAIRPDDVDAVVEVGTAVAGAVARVTAAADLAADPPAKRPGEPG